MLDNGTCHVVWMPVVNQGVKQSGCYIRLFDSINEMQHDLYAYVFEIEYRMNLIAFISLNIFLYIHLRWMRGGKEGCIFT